MNRASCSWRRAALALALLIFLALSFASDDGVTVVLVAWVSLDPENATLDADGPISLAAVVFVHRGQPAVNPSATGRTVSDLAAIGLREE